MRPHALVWIIPAALSLIALGPWPYAFYMLLRIIVCGACAYLAYAEYDRSGQSGWMFALVAAAVLFNPLMPIHLMRELWSALNVGVAVLLVAHMIAVKRKRRG